MQFIAKILKAKAFMQDLILTKLTTKISSNKKLITKKPADSSFKYPCEPCDLELKSDPLDQNWYF